MAKWYYYDNYGNKIDTDSEGLKRLAESGIISMGTVIETAEGKQVTADKIKGLFSFDPPPATPQVRIKVPRSTPAVPDEPVPPTDYRHFLDFGSTALKYLLEWLAFVIVTPILLGTASAVAVADAVPVALLLWIAWIAFAIRFIRLTITFVCAVAAAFTDFARLLVSIERSCQDRNAEPTNPIDD